MRSVLLFIVLILRYSSAQSWRYKAWNGLELNTANCPSSSPVLDISVSGDFCLHLSDPTSIACFGVGGLGSSARVTFVAAAPGNGCPTNGTACLTLDLSTTTDCSLTAITINEAFGCRCINCPTNNGEALCAEWSDLTAPTAAPTAAPTTAAPTTAAPTSAPTSSPTSCFHKDTVITYQGKSMALSELEDTSLSNCVVPHRVVTSGTRITARCGTETHTKVVRLTPNHLVYTQRGLIAAGELIVGHDRVYADLDETQPCTVVHIEKDVQHEEFFGLNCLSSVVLASGIKTSTFEKLHTIPALWMQLAGKLIGIKHASSIGVHIEKLLSNLNLI